MFVSSRSTRRIAAAVLAAGAALGATALPATAADSDRQQARRSHVEISAVQYDSPGYDNGSNRSLNKEWVEITNDGRRAVNLEGWTLADEDGNTFTFRHYRLRGHESVRVHTGEGRDRDGHLFQDRDEYVWDNRSDTATLRNDHDRRVDRESWGRGHGGGHGGGGHHRR
ncbi:lamin tail domain-containing protein [Streptomyces sp. NBC_00414]